MDTRRNLLGCATSLLALSALSGCAGPSVKPECHYPLPAPDLMQPPAPEGAYRKRMTEVLTSGQPSTESPTTPIPAPPR